jgi:hypothetical protein
VKVGSGVEKRGCWQTYGNRLQQAFKVQKGRNTLVFEQTNGLLPGVLSYMINNNGSTLSGQVVKHK